VLLHLVFPEPLDGYKAHDHLPGVLIIHGLANASLADHVLKKELAVTRDGDGSPSLCRGLKEELDELLLKPRSQEGGLRPRWRGRTERSVGEVVWAQIRRVGGILCRLMCLWLCYCRLLLLWLLRVV